MVFVTPTTDHILALEDERGTPGVASNEGVPASENVHGAERGSTPRVRVATLPRRRSHVTAFELRSLKQG